MAVQTTVQYPAATLPSAASVITTTGEAGLSNEFALSSLSSGILKQSSGTPATAVYGSDYDIPRNIMEAEAKRAYEALGSANIVFFFHCAATSGASGVVGADASSGARTQISGAYQLTSGATGSSTSYLVAATDGASFSKVLRSGQNWYVAGRFKVSTAIDAECKAFVGGGDAAGAKLAMGVDGAAGTTNFMLSGPSGTAIDSAVAIDTSTHTHRAYRVSTTTTYQVDANAAVTGNVNIATDHAPFVYVQNGTTASARTLQLVWWAAAAPAL